MTHRHARTVARALVLPLLAVTLAAWSLPASVSPLAGRITGTVTDAETGDPLIGASVRIQGTSIGAATNIDGQYTIANAPAGTHTLVVSYVGYGTREIPVTVVDGETVEVDAQLSYTTELEGIEITAQAEGQLNAINEQLRSNTITNVVSAARIQELPDVNAAESIGRLPGVSIQRSGGEATRVAIRGLSPKYNTVTVNGVRLPGTGGDDRSVDLSLVSSNALGGISVTKAITADMDADAIGGAIDLRLREAPAGLAVDVLGQGGYTALQDYYGNYKFVASASNRFFGNRLGVIASVNTDEYDRSADKFSAGYREGASTEAGVRRTVPANVSLREENVTRGRTGASAVVDLQIPAGKITGNTFYNQLSADGLYRINNMDAQSGGRNYFLTELRQGTTSVLTGALGIEQDFGWLRYDATVSQTGSETNNPEDFVFQFGQEGGTLVTAPVTEETAVSDVPSFFNPDSTNTVLQNVFVYSADRYEDQSAVQLNVEVPFLLSDDIAGYVKTGGKLRWLDRANDLQQLGRGGFQYGGANNTQHPLACIDQAIPEWGIFETVADQGALPIGTLLSDYTRDDIVDQYSLGFTADPDRLLELGRAFQTEGCVNFYENQPIGSLGSDYTGTEAYQAGYVMAELSFWDKVTLIPGLRFEADQSDYTGYRFREVVSGNDVQPPAELDTLVNNRNNSFWLPMVHLNVKPTDWLQVRLARTETLTRPDYIQYAPITTIDQYRQTVRAANGALRPAHSTNYDLSVAVFDDKVGLFSVSAFTKEIDDLIIPVSFVLRGDETFISLFEETLEGANVPQSWYSNDTPTVYTNINNPFSARYNGFEVDWQTNFWYLPSVLKGLVLNVNYTYINSEMTYQGYYVRRGEQIRAFPPVYEQVLDDTLRVGRIPDQPSHIANVTVGYDVSGFSTRFSVLYQTDVATGINASNPLFDSFSGEYLRLDLSASQELANGLEVFTNFNNLNGRPDRNFLGSDILNPTYTEYYGLTVDVGARYRF